MGKYKGGGKKKGKGEHCRRHRNDDDDIKALRGLYKEPKDDDNDWREDDDKDQDWDDIEEKEPEEDNDDENDVVRITAVQLFGMPAEAFISKETENKRKK